MPKFRMIVDVVIDADDEESAIIKVLGVMTSLGAEADITEGPEEVDKEEEVIEEDDND